MPCPEESIETREICEGDPERRIMIECELGKRMNILDAQHIDARQDGTYKCQADGDIFPRNDVRACTDETQFTAKTV